MESFARKFCSSHEGTNDNKNLKFCPICETDSGFIKSQNNFPTPV